MHNPNQAQQTIAKLESRLDHIETELSHLNTLLLHCGFPEGIKTLKTTIEDLLTTSEEDSSDFS